MSIKTDALRRIAAAIDRGAGEPISITYYMATVDVLVYDECRWLAWLKVLGGDPSDGERRDDHPGLHRPTVSWTDGALVVLYQDKMTVQP